MNGNKKNCFVSVMQHYSQLFWYKMFVCKKNLAIPVEITSHQMVILRSGTKLFGIKSNQNGIKSNYIIVSEIQYYCTKLFHFISLIQKTCNTFHRLIRDDKTLYIAILSQRFTDIKNGNKLICFIVLLYLFFVNKPNCITVSVI